MLATLAPYLPTAREWVALAIGAGLGLAASIFWLRAQAALRRIRLKVVSHQKNQAWARFNSLHPTLVLAKAGPEPDGTFAEGSFDVTLEGKEYELPAAIDTTVRRKHEASWIEAGHTDDLKVGFKYFRATRVSDSPDAILKGNAHLFKIRCHTYRYFDFLATHRRLALGLPAEMSVLAPYIEESDGDRPVDGFPNPFSVGLSLFCEGGRKLVMTIRTDNVHSGGDWHGGKLFNAVGENANPSDFKLASDGKLHATPYDVARRGLHEEMGFSDEAIAACSIRLHSFAWAIDIRDHKFFGWAETDLAQSEVLRLWQSAKDRGESKRLEFFPVTTRRQCVHFWRSAVINSRNWSPEAFFCTSRTLLVRDKVDSADLLGPLRADA